ARRLPGLRRGAAQGTGPGGTTRRCRGQHPVASLATLAQLCGDTRLGRRPPSPSWNNDLCCTMNTPPPIASTFADGPLGRMLLAASPQGLCGLWFTDGQGDCPDQRGWPIDASHPVLVSAIDQVRRYFDGQLHDFDLPLDMSAGTPFQ